MSTSSLLSNWFSFVTVTGTCLNRDSEYKEISDNNEGRLHTSAPVFDENLVPRLGKTDARCAASRTSVDSPAGGESLSFCCPSGPTRGPSTAAP